MADITGVIERLREGELRHELHPVETGRHEAWDIAREIVGHHHAKSDLVQVVAILLDAIAALQHPVVEGVEK